ARINGPRAGPRKSAGGRALRSLRRRVRGVLADHRPAGLRGEDGHGAHDATRPSEADRALRPHRAGSPRRARRADSGLPREGPGRSPPIGGRAGGAPRVHRDSFALDGVARARVVGSAPPDNAYEAGAPFSIVTFRILPVNLFSPCLYSSVTGVSLSIPTSVPSSPE